MPRDERDFIIAASTHGASLRQPFRLTPDQSDALCRLSTEAGVSAHVELYTDRDEVIFDAQRPLILTGIESLATRADLADRSIVVTLPPISSDRRVSERTFRKGIRRGSTANPGALFTAMSGALAAPHRTQRCLPRMADFIEWASSAEKMPWLGGRHHCGDVLAATPRHCGGHVGTPTSWRTSCEGSSRR